MPLPEILFILVLVGVVVVAFIGFLTWHINRHMKILEDATLDVKKVQEKERDSVRRLELDLQKLEASEAELFVTKVVPTVSKLENFVAVEMLKGKQPEEIKGAIVKKGINANLATKVVNSMSYYLDFFKKLPGQRVNAHIQTMGKMNVGKADVKAAIKGPAPVPKKTGVGGLPPKKVMPAKSKVPGKPVKSKMTPPGTARK